MVLVVGETFCVPEVPLAVKPEAIQVFALEELQVSVLLCPLSTVVGEAVSETVGRGDCQEFRAWSIG